MSYRALTGITGITIFTSIYVNAKANQLPGAVAQAATDADLPSSSFASSVALITQNNVAAAQNAAGASQAIISAELAAAQDVNVTSFRNVWLSIASFAIFSALRKSIQNHVEMQGILRTI